MNLWQWAIILYVVIDLASTVAVVGKKYEVTPTIALLTVLTHIALIFCAINA